MNTNEMVNEEVIELTEEIATAGFGNGIKEVAAGGLAVLVGLGTYKYLIKPMAAKIIAKIAKKKQQAMEEEFDDFEDAEIDE